MFISLKKNFTNFLILLLSSLFSIYISEVLIKTILFPDEISEYSNRVMLFESDKNFINYGSIVKYHPNINFRSKTIYINQDKTKAVSEYDYKIKTNNLGLIMSKDVKKNQAIKIIIGDSFTEGQGANPWFYKLEMLKKKNNYQYVNAGILGTGPMQWNILANKLKQENNFTITDIHILLILDDLRRPVWNFDQTKINCLTKTICKYSSGYQGFDFKNKGEKEILKEVLSNAKNKPLYPKTIFNIAKNSYILKAIYYYIYLPIFSKRIENNLNALLQLYNMSLLESKITIINTKNQIESMNRGKILENNILGKKIKKWSNENNIKVNFCLLEKNDFHNYDGHPNENGYTKILDCVIS